jgi:flagellar hook-associated protein 1
MSRLSSVGISGLNAANAGLQTTGHNIANVNTPGYSRQRVEQATAIAEQTGGGFLGKGTTIDTVRRIYNEFLVAQVRDADSLASAAGTLGNEIARLTGLLGDDATGLQPVLSRFFASVQNLASNPGDLTVRATVLADANALAQRFTALDTQFRQLRSDTNGAIANSVTSINSFTSQIATLNQRIAIDQASGQPPNDLLDQRDALLRDLGKQVRVSVTKQTDGSINVFLGTGQPLVVGNSSFTLSVGPDPAFVSDSRLLLSNGVTSVPIQSTSLGGGELAGYFDFRNGALTNAQNSLGRIAQVLGTQFNRQHALGADRTGAMGGAFFNLGTPAAIANTGNAGTGVLTAAITNEAVLQASDYRVSWDGANYTVRRLADGVTQTFAALPATVDGVQLTIAGAPAAGDSFLVQAVRNAVANFSVAITDPARIAAATPIASSAAVANLGAATIAKPTVNGPTPNVNLQQTVTITFTSATNFDVVGIGTGNPVGVAYTSGGNITYNGWTTQITGTPRAGDVFTIQTNPTGIADNGNAQALSLLQGATMVNGATLSAAYGQTVSDVGVAARTAEAQRTAQEATLAAAEQAQQATSGVNLDEEAANLVRYQQAYQASARYIQIANSLFDELLGLGR